MKSRIGKIHFTQFVQSWWDFISKTKEARNKHRNCCRQQKNVTYKTKWNTYLFHYQIKGPVGMGSVKPINCQWRVLERNNFWGNSTEIHSLTPKETKTKWFLTCEKVMKPSYSKLRQGPCKLFSYLIKRKRFRLFFNARLTGTIPAPLLTFLV